MKIGYFDLELDCLEFRDRLGSIRQSYGCSIKGLQEYHARLSQLQEILNDANEKETIEGLYLKNEYFRFNCDRCLRLNGIKPKWVNAQILTALLFTYNQGASALALLNSPRNPAPEGSNNISATYGDIVVAIKNYTDSLSEALDILENRPANEVTEILEAKAKSDLELLKQTDPKTWHKQKARARHRGKKQEEKKIQNKGESVNRKKEDPFLELLKVKNMVKTRRKKKEERE